MGSASPTYLSHLQKGQHPVLAAVAAAVAALVAIAPTTTRAIANSFLIAPP